jgi:hypothetical protein
MNIVVAYYHAAVLNVLRKSHMSVLYDAVCLPNAMDG